ncbi:MAG: flagellar basal body rod protein FlgC [candidate division Zixibacteria bacterium]|nr:flagellar basal body rod protein FlgC [candidate division Zixibacteria bacterium]
MDGIFSSIEISGSGMSVQRRKMNVVSENIANAETTKTQEGGPYRRKRLEVSATDEKLPFNTILKKSQSALSRTNSMHMTATPMGSRRYGDVSVTESKELTAGDDAFKLVYDPGHPDADQEGYVKMPDIELINEMVDMMSANRGYEANALAISASKAMVKDALDI